MASRGSASLKGYLAVREANATCTKSCTRQAGDSYILLEYGENVLDLALRLRVYTTDPS